MQDTALARHICDNSRAKLFGDVGVCKAVCVCMCKGCAAVKFCEMVFYWTISLQINART